MNTKSCFGYPWAKISQCQMPDPQTKKKSWDGYWEKQGYWERVCSNDPTRPGCKLYESQKPLEEALVIVNKGFIARSN